MTARRLEEVLLKDIRENPVALRNVDRTSETYLGLVESIRQNGVFNAIVLRTIKDPETGKDLYGLVDGLHRYSASVDAGRDTIPAQILSMEDGEVLEAQIIGNVQKVETRPVEYSKQLLRILAANPMLTEAELCKRLSKGPTWLKDRLGLPKLEESIGKLVDEGHINLSNAYALAKLPHEEQAAFLDRAMTMTPQEFVGTATARAKELREAARAGRDAAPAAFVAVAHARKIGELKDEMDKPTIGPLLVDDMKITDPKDGFALGVKWALHLDKVSIQQAEAKDKARKAELAEQKARREADRNKKKSEEAAKEAAALQAKLAGKELAGTAVSPHGAAVPAA